MSFRSFSYELSRIDKIGLTRLQTRLLSPDGPWIVFEVGANFGQSANKSAQLFARLRFIVLSGRFQKKTVGS